MGVGELMAEVVLGIDGPEGICPKAATVPNSTENPINRWQMNDMLATSCTGD